MADLTAEARDALPSSAFALAKSREYPIHEREHAIDSLVQALGKAEEPQVRAAVKARYPSMKVKKAVAEALAKGEGAVDIRTPLWKDDAQRLVYGVVLTPGLRDSQGDIASAEEIQKAAHAFLVEFRKHDVQHNETPAAVETVESFIAPQDMEIAGNKVLKGAWVMAVHVSDDAAWQRVEKGEIGGFSIGGSAIRLPEAA